MYEDIAGAIWFVYYLCLGEFGKIADFDLGKPTNATWGWVFFLLGSFLLLVHMMNMLIAKMGDVFAKNREIQYQL